MGLEKKKEERALFKNIISAGTKGRKEKDAAKKKPDFGEGGKSERTCIHGNHFPDLPCGEITIEGTSFVKHCTTATTKKSNNGFEKKDHCKKI